MSIPKLDDFHRWCDEAIESWRAIKTAGAEMIELAKKPTLLPDGFGSGGNGPKVQGGSELTRTEAAANGRGFQGTGSKEADDKVTLLPHDWVAEMLGDGFTLARESRTSAKRATQTFKAVAGRADGRVGRQQTSGGICMACLRSVSGAVDDRLRSGYCDACRKAWDRWKARWTKDGNQDMAGDRFAFEHWRMISLTGTCAYHADCPVPDHQEAVTDPC